MDIFVYVVTLSWCGRGEGETLGPRAGAPLRARWCLLSRDVLEVQTV